MKLIFLWGKINSSHSLSAIYTLDKILLVHTINDTSITIQVISRDQILLAINLEPQQVIGYIDAPGTLADYRSWPLRTKFSVECGSVNSACIKAKRKLQSGGEANVRNRRENSIFPVWLAINHWSVQFSTKCRKTFKITTTKLVVIFDTDLPKC